MNITTEANPPQRGPAIDYPLIAKLYNDLPLSESIKLDKVYNITSFKTSLSRRGLVHGVDFKAFNEGPFCYVRKLTHAPMSALC